MEGYIFLFRGDSAHFACKPIETMILLIQGVSARTAPTLLRLALQYFIVAKQKIPANLLFYGEGEGGL